MKKKFWRVDRCRLGGLLLLIFSTAVAAADLEVKGARLRLLPGDLPAGGYFSLSNVSKQSAALVGAERAAFEHVMMHRSTEKDGMAGMEPVLRLEVAPGETLNFAPGGYHLMLMKRLVPLAIGEKVNVTLLFADGAHLPVIFQVVSPASQ
ncbi:MULTISPECIES: copper chaperone PCu(A)C [Pseudomonas aeruginosa group]|uniref:copper chaperone PCu(A)C n=1 Tax=Pseudomonas aeruginosa group TaxID=136841 RepID=UPI001ED9B15C|nr:copper chaperone PCu(A)C [Pseudomonas aeruginosa]MCS7928296.1 copper chaperone PCu(A)C [Pseudomonas aeruginosa]MCS9455048.1 copper chaperone PCu(A)C [Pseudomonas aeruginosa]MCT0364137.1 copper chaperone PCu(A)C [Pseudomonas aeruginosa]MDF5927306.1 copper chaperone PCu(A)C [Pseudomonas aeruginosa]